MLTQNCKLVTEKYRFASMLSIEMCLRDKVSKSEGTISSSAFLCFFDYVILIIFYMNLTDF